MHVYFICNTITIQKLQEISCISIKNPPGLPPFLLQYIMIENTLLGTNACWQGITEVCQNQESDFKDDVTNKT